MTKRIKDPGSGTFLLSDPFMLDPNFRRSVVLLTEHNDDGTVGFVLNKPTNLSLAEVAPEFPEFDAPLFLGGPVQPETLHFVHRIESLSDSSLLLADGVFWGGDFDLLKILIENGDVKPGDIRFFLGYSGWGANQLQDEMDAKSWIVSSASNEFTFSSDFENLWKNILESMGRKYKVISNYPSDPTLN